MDKMVRVFREVWRVLRPDGTVWLNLGDSYNANGRDSHGTRIGCKQGTNRASATMADNVRPNVAELKPKDLIGIPWRVAFALQADGWWLRQDIVWHKPSTMPESVQDRCTKAHEYIFLLTKSARYFWDAAAIYEPCSPNTHARLSQDIKKQIGSTRANGGTKTNGNMKAVGRKFDPFHGNKNNSSFDAAMAIMPTERNRRSVWTIPSQPYKGAHFATYPEKLVEPCILAGSSEKGKCSSCDAALVRMVERTDQKEQSSKGSKFDAGKTASRDGGDRTQAVDRYMTKTTGWKPQCKCYAGKPIPCIVLDPFNGSGTTGVVAERHGRDYVGIELNWDYIGLTKKRMAHNQMKLVA